MERVQLASAERSSLLHVLFHLAVLPGPFSLKLGIGLLDRDHILYRELVLQGIL